jgi:hypothetical protein
MFQDLIHRFVQWCYYSKDYAFVRDSKYGVPILQSLHLVGITLLLGTTLILNLRLLDFGFRKFPLQVLAQQLWRWTLSGLALAICAGIMVFLPDPTRYAHSGPFRLKMSLLCLALLFHFTVFRITVRQEPASHSRLRSAAIAATSLTLWFGVGWSARAIAFFQ